jgi:dipeptidyl aminopeptidase/acylaminoacyl peptidase
MSTVAPYGHWSSSLRAEDAAAGKVSLSELASDGTSLYWLESRPAEGGRVVLVRWDGGQVMDVSPGGVSVRSRVHEYGGGASCLVPGHGVGVFAYVDLPDQRVWLVESGRRDPTALSPEPPPGQFWAHGGLAASPDGDWVFAVREIRDSDSQSPRRAVVALGTRADNRGEAVLVQGHDFVGAPRVHPAGDRLATVVWDHPDMPWDASSVVVTPIAQIADVGTDGGRTLAAAGPSWTVAGGGDESVGQPQWRRDGGLWFVSDRHGWWQPYAHSGADDGQPPQRMTESAAEFHGPDWVLGQCTMAGIADGTLVARMTSEGTDSLVHFAANGTGTPWRPVSQPCTSITALCPHGNGVAYIGATPDGPADVWVIRSLGHPQAGAVRPARNVGLRPGDVSPAEPFSLVGRSGRPVHGVLHRPTLTDTVGPPGVRPPLVVACHGGPTSSAGSGFDVLVQFFTSRGFAYAGVDYAGSTGYGRAYRCSLRGEWGVADAEDCLDAALHLAGSGQVDGARMAVRGGSSGGLTALNALAAGEGFSAAAAWYGVTDLLALAASTHDFEAHYMDRLIGPLPDARALYEARSPVNRAADLRGSVLLLQGTEDPIVPPAQAEHLRDALLAEGRHCTLILFAGESHGFRRADTLVAALEEELTFYRSELRL